MVEDGRTQSQLPLLIVVVAVEEEYLQKSQMQAVQKYRPQKENRYRLSMPAPMEQLSCTHFLLAKRVHTPPRPSTSVAAVA